MENGQGEATLCTDPISMAFADPLHRRSIFKPTVLNYILLYLFQSLSFIFSSTALILVTLWACLQQLSLWMRRGSRRATPYEWDMPRGTDKERATRDLSYYARRVGLDIRDDVVETDDGFRLRMHAVLDPGLASRDDRRGKHKSHCHHITPSQRLCPLFARSISYFNNARGCFITSEERSLAFWLTNQGYQVFLGNNRGVFNMGHREFSRSDPRFWDWTIRELAIYDLPAMIDYVREMTGHEKIGLISHSQGAGAAFLALSQGMRPEIGSKIACFIALAPAVYAGPLTSTWLFSALGSLGWKSWTWLFGVLDFVPLMRLSYDYVPSPRFFGVIGYAMFAYLFQWTDTNWLLRRKTKQFRFTPTPVSSAALFWWCGKGGFASRGCMLDPRLSQWFGSDFPPLSIYYGGRDFLINTEKLLDRLQSEPNVELMRVEKLPQAEHCDFYYAADAVEWCFSSIVDDIEKARLRIPSPSRNPSPRPGR